MSEYFVGCAQAASGLNADFPWSPASRAEPTSRTKPHEPGRAPRVAPVPRVAPTPASQADPVSRADPVSQADPRESGRLPRAPHSQTERHAQATSWPPGAFGEP